MSTYFEALCAAMTMVAREKPRAIFMGQAVACPGTAMSTTFRDVPREKLLELPVAEDMQLGMAIGMALNGDFPVCCYPRINFLLLAMNQLVLHLDKIPLYSKYRLPLIIRTGVASDQPLDPGVQHLGDFSAAIYDMCQTIRVVSLPSAEYILPAYERALVSEGPTLMVEHLGRYQS
jgi:pyruvate/2-oxoglutarate/acetoin dehydrogenase E1 component